MLHSIKTKLGHFFPLTSLTKSAPLYPKSPYHKHVFDLFHHSSISELILFNYTILAYFITFGLFYLRKKRENDETALMYKSCIIFIASNACTINRVGQVTLKNELITSY